MWWSSDQSAASYSDAMLTLVYIRSLLPRIAGGVFNVLVYLSIPVEVVFLNSISNYYPKLSAFDSP